MYAYTTTCILRFRWRFSKKIGGHGLLCDLGISHLAQMLYIMGMPELESVYGVSSADYYLKEKKR
jgi:predicted dehydrogenase